MSVRRVMGSETEFGVLAVGEPHANATVLSTRVVTSMAPVRSSSATVRSRNSGSQRSSSSWTAM